MSESNLIFQTTSEGLAHSIELNNGNKMPMLGLGVFLMNDEKETIQAIQHALKIGYRRIDTAAIYKNEKTVGTAIQQSSIAREDIFLTTKIWNEDIRSGNVTEAFQTCLNHLQTDYIDLLLLHWPVGKPNMEAWKQMEKIYQSGRAKSIGVSNYLSHHLDDLARNWSIVPAINQIEFHPKLQTPRLIHYCNNKGINLEAWSPLMRGEILDHDGLKTIANHYGKSVAQVVLRWNLQLGICTIPKSVHPERIASNADIFDFQLTKEDMKAIEALDDGIRVGEHPDHIDF